MKKEKILGILRFSGVIALVVYWSFTIASILHNPWFSVMSNALSDLGALNANEPWIYNYGLIATTPFLFVFSIYLIYIAKNKVQCIGGAFITISSFFLTFIGVFHSGTRPHVFVSSYFFLQFFLGMLVFGALSNRALRILTTIIFGVALGGAFLPWPSTATIEIYEIALIGISVSAIAAFNPEKLGNKEHSP
jgi:hypothetical membrane protein